MGSSLSVKDRIIVLVTFDKCFSQVEVIGEFASDLIVGAIPGKHLVPKLLHTSFDLYITDKYTRWHAILIRLKYFLESIERLAYRLFNCSSAQGLGLQDSSLN